MRSSSRREDFFDALALAAAFSSAALDGGTTCAFGLESLADFFNSFFDAWLDLDDFSGTFDFLEVVFPLDDVDELEEYELSDPESLESEDPEPDELERFRRFSVDTLRTGEGCFFLFVETAFSIARLSGTGEGFRFFETTGDTLRTGEYLLRFGLMLGERVRITFLT